MAATKRSFSTFESNQNDIIESNQNKKPKHNNNNQKKVKKHRKKRNTDLNFFDVKFSEPDDFDREQSHCLEFHDLLSFIQEHHLYGLIRNELKLWYEAKSQNKNANEVPTDGKIDIHLFHNRHNSGLTGFAFVYFENKSDASYILQLSNQKKLRTNTKSRAICCEWKQNAKDAYSSIYQTDIKLKSETNLIKLSNLHWKTTLFHLHHLFNSLNDSLDAETDEAEANMDFDPRWMKIMEDKNGFPKCQALVMFHDAKHAEVCVDQLQDHVLFGRKLKLEYSSYAHEGALLTKYNADNLQLAGLSKKLLVSNIKQSVKTSDVVKFLKVHITNKDKSVDDMVKDVYLMHNLQRVCGGKCFVEFDTTENAKYACELLQFKQLCNRTAIVEYGHVHNEHEDDNEMFPGERLRDKTSRLFMSNLAWDTKEKDIKRFFGEKLPINSVYFNVTINGYPKGSAFITFQGFDVASKAFDKSNGKKLKNRVVTLDFAKMYMSNNQAYDQSYNDNDQSYDNNEQSYDNNDQSNENNDQSNDNEY